MAALRRRLDGVRVVVSDELGIPADAKKAVMWALLGFLTWHGVPGTTLAAGSEAPRVLSRITPGAEPLRLPPPANAYHKQPRRLRVLVPEERHDAQAGGVRRARRRAAWYPVTSASTVTSSPPWGCLRRPAGGSLHPASSTSRSTASPAWT